jgi:hypothetical protein
MKKQTQLGMNPSTASGRLLKDLLFKFAKDAGHVCYQCGKELDRDSFSIEHKTPWLDSENPVELFFKLDNIAFSHKSCNVGAARKPNKLNLTPEERKKHNATLERQRWQKLSFEEHQAIRRKKYKRYGV